METQKITEEHSESELIRVPIDRAEAVIAQSHVLLDIREPDEFKEGHIRGALNIPKGMLEFKLGEVPQINSKAAKIVMYCKDGKRCVEAAKTLIKMGYKNIFSLLGGFDAWVKAGKHVEQENDAS